MKDFLMLESVPQKDMLFKVQKVNQDYCHSRFHMKRYHYPRSHVTLLLPQTSHVTLLFPNTSHETLLYLRLHL